MKSAVIVFPGSNCDRDAAWALELITGVKPHMVWHKETALPDGVELVIIPGGFSYGDYLRSGAMAARAAIMPAIKAHATSGKPLIGICNGFQILTEAGLLPGALTRNQGLKFVCKPVDLKIANADTLFTRAYGTQSETTIPIAHHDGCFTTDAETLKAIEGNGQVVFRYTDNPNGSINDIAGVMNKAGNVMGMMPHPERASDPVLGKTGGRGVFESVAGLVLA
jgi:phosphoribosylformylglycinamidine synthase